VAPLCAGSGGAPLSITILRRPSSRSVRGQGDRQHAAIEMGADPLGIDRRGSRSERWKVP
jgi:hypothetical protein